MTAGTSMFLYGTLRYLALLKVVLGRAPDGVQARLRGHEVRAVRGASYPAIRAAAGKSCEGLLLRNLTAAEKARLDFYEEAYHYVLAPVEVETEAGTEPANVYFPTEAAPPLDGAWDLAAWADAHGEITTEAAREVMLLMGERSAEDVAAIYPQILTRAHAALRARARPVPREVRIGMAAAGVEVTEARRPHSGFFSVAAERLRFPLFGGGVSAEVPREAFLMADAVTVLPYDPGRDRVLLIEQFRFGVFKRGDPSPWTLEPIAGRVDPGEGSEGTARREAREEAGLELEDLHFVSAYYPSPAGATEHVTSFVGIADLPDGIAGRIGGEAGEAEDIRSHLLSFETLIDLVATGEAANGPLILTALWLQRERARLRAGTGREGTGGLGPGGR